MLWLKNLTELFLSKIKVGDPRSTFPLLKSVSFSRFNLDSHFCLDFFRSFQTQILHKKLHKDVRVIWTRIARVEGENADHLTSSTALVSIFCCKFWVKFSRTRSICRSRTVNLSDMKKWTRLKGFRMVRCRQRHLRKVGCSLARPACLCWLL